MNSLTGLQTARVWPEDAQDSSFRGEFSKKNTCQSPAKRVENFLTRAEVAQLVEQGTENPRVGSSILSPGTIFRFQKDQRRPEMLNKIRFLAVFFVLERPPTFIGILIFCW